MDVVVRMVLAVAVAVAVAGGRWGGGMAGRRGGGEVDGCRVKLVPTWCQRGSAFTRHQVDSKLTLANLVPT